MTQNIRLMGLLKFLAGSLVFAAIVNYFMGHGLPTGSPFKIIGPAIPGAFALVGLVEMTVGTPYQRSRLPGMRWLVGSAGFLEFWSWYWRSY